MFTWQSTPKCHWNGDQHCERAHEHANNIVHQPPPPPLLSLSPSHPAPAAASTLGHVDADRNSNTQYPTPFSHPHTTHSHSTGITTTTPIRAPARCVWFCALCSANVPSTLYTPRTICAHGLRAVAMGTRAHIHTLVYRTDIHHIRIYYAIACVYPVHSQRVHKWNSSGCDVDGGMATAAAAASIAATASAAATATAAASLAGDV